MLATEGRVRLWGIAGHLHLDISLSFAVNCTEGIIIIKAVADLRSSNMGQ